MSDNRLLIAGVVMAIIGALLVGVILFSTLRFRRARNAAYEQNKRATQVEHGHLASRITPFGSRSINPGGDQPRFAHTPGSNMRIATRRADGAWQFNSPRDGFSPSGVTEFSPSPTASYFSRQSISSTAKLSSKGGFSRKAGLMNEYEFEPPPDALPPPAYAYGYESPGYTRQYNAAP